MSMAMTTEAYKLIIDEICTGKIGFDPIIHLQDTALLEQIADSHMSVFKKIPREYLTDDLIDRNAKCLCIAYGLEQHYTPHDYEATALKLLGAEMHISFVHKELLTERMVRLAFDRNMRETLSYRLKLEPQQQALFTLEMLKQAVAADPEVVSKLTPEEIENIGDDALLLAFKKYPEHAFSLIGIGKPKLFARMVADGAWMFPGVFDEHPRPAGVSLAIQGRMKLKSWMRKEALYYNAYISNCTLDEIAPSIKSRARCRMLLEIFPTEDLAKHFKSDPAMKGCILEDQLGL
jgi:hypothetical protein